MIDNLRRTTASLVVFAAILFPAPTHAQWERVWSDEFDDAAVDPDKWSFQTGTGAPNCGWGNLELQYYREENATLENGKLVITAKEESSPGDICAPGYDYTSARLRTINKGDWLHGRFEVNAKLPSGQGLWPAIWMLPTNENFYGAWAASGEIDIMELRGQEPNIVLGTIYYGAPFPSQSASSQSYTLPGGDFSEGFHTFALEWDPWELRWFVDDTLYRTENSWFTVNGSYPAPFDREFHLILNVAVGGGFPGPPDASTVFPQTMEVDFVRVYRQVGGLPEISLVEPASGSNFEAASTLDLSATASDPDGSVTMVEFLQDEGVVAFSRNAPYTETVTDLYPGCYRVRARVIDNVGYEIVTDPIDITVGGGCTEQTPYLMAATPIPGIVEAEYFDLGGPGVAYNDTDEGNVVDDFRASENVDVSHAGTDLGFAVVRVIRGEWLEYTVDIKETAKYQLTSRIASVGNSGFRLEFDGVDKTGLIDVPATGGELSWINLVTPDIELEAGVQVMRFVPTTSGIGLSRMTFVKTGSIAAEEIPSTSRRIVFESHPNPFSNDATVTFEIDQPSRVDIDVFDVLGRTVKRIESGYYAPGTHSTTLEADALPVGTYILRLTVDDQRITRLVTRLP